MYPGEDQLPPHHHHLPKMDDDDDDDFHHDNGDYEPQTHPYPTAVGHQNPPATPQQPLQPPKPLFSPGSRTPSKKGPTPSATPPNATPPPPPPQLTSIPPQQPLQRPQPLFLPNSPPPKSRAPPPQYHHRHDDDDDDGGNKRRRQLCAVIITLLLLLGLTALILWLLYRPSKPHFTAIAAAVYSLNTTSVPSSFVTTSLQLTVLTRNPNKRTSLYYDSLTVAIHYQNQPITPPAPLPPLHHLKRSTVLMSPVVGGGTPVAVPPGLVEGLVADEAYGVVGLSWVLVGRVKYRAGWFRSGHSRVYVRCDVMVGLKSGGGVGGNPSGQVPLLGNPPCFVDI